CGNADHIRFRDADVEEAIREFLGEVLRARRIMDIAVDDDDIRMRRAELGKRQAKGFAGRLARLHARPTSALLVCIQRHHARAPRSANAFFASSGVNGLPWWFGSLEITSWMG